MLQDFSVKIVKEFSKVKRNWKITRDSMQCLKWMTVTKYTSMKAFKMKIIPVSLSVKFVNVKPRAKINLNSFKGKTSNTSLKA